MIGLLVLALTLSSDGAVTPRSPTAGVGCHTASGAHTHGETGVLVGVAAAALALTLRRRSSGASDPVDG
jgi:MYXO-CTERM domain-containing protein